MELIKENSNNEFVKFQGFMGKVLLEKLLYSCSDVKEIMILMRPKKAKTAAERVEEMTKLPVINLNFSFPYQSTHLNFSKLHFKMFKRIREEKPDLFNKISPVWGDITSENLGLNEEHFKHVTEASQVVFHLAASLRLEATLKSNVLMNLGGTQNVLDLCKKMTSLVSLVYLSTAFCNSDQEVMDEKIYDWPHSPKDLISCARWMSEQTMDVMSKTMMAPHPNTYTYTKRLAEILVRDEFPNLPVCVVRPSIGEFFGKDKFLVSFPIKKDLFHEICKFKKEKIQLI